MCKNVFRDPFGLFAATSSTTQAVQHVIVDVFVGDGCVLQWKQQLRVFSSPTICLIAQPTVTSNVHVRRGFCSWT